MTEKEILPVKTLKPNDCAAPALTVLGHWNSKSSIEVKHLRPEAAVYKKSLQMIEMLLAGTFARYNAMDIDFLEGFNLYDEELNKSWTIDELKTAIDRHDYKCESLDTGNFPKSFTDFCFNPRTRYSFLFSVIGDRRPNGMPEKSKSTDILNLYLRRLDLYREDKQELIHAVNFIMSKYDPFYIKIGKFYTDVMTEQNFHELFIRFVWEKIRDREGFSPKMMSNFWRIYIDWIKREEPKRYKFYFEVTAERIEAAEIKYKAMFEALKRTIE